MVQIDKRHDVEGMYTSIASIFLCRIYKENFKWVERMSDYTDMSDNKLIKKLVG